MCDRHYKRVLEGSSIIDKIKLKNAGTLLFLFVAKLKKVMQAGMPDRLRKKMTAGSLWRNSGMG